MSAGTLSLVKQYFRATVAGCSTFRTLVGAADAAAALNRVYRDVLPGPVDGKEYTLDELRGIRPYCLVWSERMSETAIATGTFESTGIMVARFVDDVPELLENNPPEAVRQFEETVSGIAESMKALAGSAGYLNITGVDVQPAGLGDETSFPSKGLVVVCEVSVTWDG